MMDSSRLEKAETIFQQLVSLPVDRRPPILADLCGGDAELRDFVDRLLTHDDSGMGGFLDSPIIAARLPDGVGRITTPQRIGNFELIRRISEGGMGIVYEARQANPQRAVAVKVIRGGLHVDEYTVRLFQRETWALARLRHPGIAAIYEAGQTEDGQHYFAMELVDGRPLMEYVRERQLSRTERLELFLKICDAIHYAHQRGVMHRDLKPSNILIDEQANPKILDFGLARITDLEPGGMGVSPVSSSMTATGRIQGTLSYMSPEQACGQRDEIDTRSDVYSLGVILYELLTDSLPYDASGLPLPDAVQVICTRSPRKSERLKGDLETIVFKSLEKEPRHRYASAAALADDVQHWLSNQPIEARRHSTTYVLFKALHRHRIAAAVAFAFVGIVTASAIALALMYQRESRARKAESTQRRLAELETDRANQEFRKAQEEQKKTEQFAQFMQQMIQGVGPSVAQGRDTTMLKEMMDAAAKRIESGELADMPAAEFRLRDTISEVYMEIGELKAAERITTPMVELARRAFGSLSEEYAIALDSHASWLHAMGRYDEGMAEAEEALSIYRQIHPGDHELTLAALNRIGSFLISRARPAEALTKHEEALAMSKRLNPGDHYDVAISTSKYADCFMHLGRYPEALPAHQEALAMFRRLSPGDNPDVSIGLARVAFDLTQLGRPAEALPMFEEALAMRRRLFPGAHPRVAETLSVTANCLISLNRPEDAWPLLEEALAMTRQLFPGDHQVVGTNLGHLGNCLVTLNRPAEAQPHLEESVAMLRRLYPTGHPSLAASLSKYASCLSSLNRSADALPAYEEALAIYQRTYTQDHPLVASALINLASGLQSVGQFAPALQRCDEGLSMARRVQPPNHPDIINAEIRRGSILIDLGQLADAESILAPAWQGIAERTDVRDKIKSQCRETLARLYDARHAAEPDKGFDARAAEYRAMLPASHP